MSNRTLFRRDLLNSTRVCSSQFKQTIDRFEQNLATIEAAGCHGYPQARDGEESRAESKTARRSGSGNIAVEVIEQPAPGVVAVTEFDETGVRKAS
jgi:hypothetical protein